MLQQNKSKTAKEIVRDNLCYDCSSHPAEEVFTARYCRPAFTFASGFHVFKMSGIEDGLIQKRCIIRPKVFHPVILIQKTYLKKSFHLHLWPQ